MAGKRPVLLVEGRDDREVLYQVCNLHGVNNLELFDTKATDGYENLRDRLSVLPKTGVPTIGAILDADVDTDARWQSICDALRQAGYRDLPVRPTPGGTVIDAAGFPRIGLWMMPDNRTRGALEDFLAFLVDEDDGLLPRARQVVDEIPVESRPFPPERHVKAEMHTWLAWQEEPGTPLGLALTRRYLDPNHPRVHEFVAWLRSVFS